MGSTGIKCLLDICKIKDRILTNQMYPRLFEIFYFLFCLNLEWKQQFEPVSLYFVADAGSDLGCLKRDCTAACTNWERSTSDHGYWLNQTLLLCVMKLLRNRCKVSSRTRGKIVSKYLINTSKCLRDIRVREIWCLLWKLVSTGVRLNYRLED